jgi:hypothetical protein
VTRSTIYDRICFGPLGTFIPTGKAVHIGPAAGRTDIEEYGEVRAIKLVVEQNQGTRAQHQDGAGADSPAKFDVAEIDRMFLAFRRAQVGKPNVGATRIAGQGWYEGGGEDSVAYDIVFIPNDKEPTFEVFAQRINDLAEILAEKVYPDRVLILRDDGTKRTVAAARFVP